MIVLEDFTRVAAGQEIPCEGQAVRCPRCGRSGLVQRSGEGITLCVHSQISEVVGDGMRTEPQDCCCLSRR